MNGLPEDVTQLFLRGQVALFGRTFERDRSVDAPGDPSLDAVVSTLWVRHHFGEGWAAELAVPVGQVTLRSPGAVPFRVSGFGDITVGGRYELGALWGLEGKRPSLALRPLLAMPTAALATDSPSPEVPPTLLALGDGVFGAGAGLVATQPLGEGFSLALPVSFQAPLTRASNGRRPGVTVAGSCDLLYQPLDGLTLRAGVSAESRGYADEQPAGTILNSGGVWWRAQAGVTGVVARRFVVGAGARVPFYMRVHGRQVAETVTMNATLGVMWMPEEEDDDHDHDHEDHQDHGEGDVEDLASGGASFALEDATVPGKLTVIDFWAEWCHPCEHLDGMLRDLAAERSDLAVRRVEIIDFEQPVSAQWFPEGGALPQVWILDEGGQILERLEGDPPAAMVEAVRRHLGP